MVEAKIDTDKKIFLLIIFLLLVGGIVGTYSYFSSRSSTENQNIKTGNLAINFVDDTPIINNLNIKPIKDEEIFDKATKKTFTIENDSTAQINARIDITNIDISDDLKDPAFKWALYADDEIVTNGDFATVTDGKINIVNNLPLDIKATKTYNLYIWISYTDLPQNQFQDDTLNMAIEVSAIQA